jgi:hypothetical protein
VTLQKEIWLTFIHNSEGSQSSMHAASAGYVDDCGIGTNTCHFRLLSFLCFSVKPGKCWLSSTSAAFTYRAGWKEEEQAKERGKGKLKERFLTCEVFEQKSGVPASSHFCNSRTSRFKPK